MIVWHVNKSIYSQPFPPVFAKATNVYYSDIRSLLAAHINTNRCRRKPTK